MNAPMLPRDDDTQHMTFEGKTVVLLHSESGTYRYQPMQFRDDRSPLMPFEGKRVVPIDRDGEYYREWSVAVADTQYCIICEGDTWTLMYYVPDINGWCDAPDDVDDFLRTHKLILAA